MKKSILAILAVIPFLACCNKNEKGFPNPFPDDEYDEKYKIGFNFTEEEKIVRILSTSENEILDNTLTKLDDVNESIMQQNGEIHKRDYTRAFAGVHGAGYYSSNIKYDETFESFYQFPTTDLKERRKMESHVESIYDYSYGQNETISDFRTFWYLAVEDTAPNYKEWTNETKPTHTIERQYEVKEDETTSDVYAKFIAKGSEDLHKPIHYDQSEYIFKPSTSDPIAGVSKEGRVVIIREEHDPSGEYELPDGRKYKQAKNTLRVSQLTKIEANDYYTVEHARIYTETAITSDPIQPNVPITFLTNPIVINYEERIYDFSTEASTETSEDTINSVRIDE